MAATLLVTALPACGAGGARNSSGRSRGGLRQPTASETAAGPGLTAKRRGGTLTVSSSQSFVELDPGQSYFVNDWAIDYATQRPLFSYRPDSYSAVSPDLAAFMPTTANGGITDGGRTLTVHIRPNVRFSPPVNRAVTSADVAYAIERGANPNVANPYFAAYFGSGATAPLEGAQSPNYKGGSIPGIQTPNSRTIVFHMTQPGATLLIGALSLPLSAPVPESFAGPLDRHTPTFYGSTYLVATGPYMVKADKSGRIAGIGYQPGISATLVRNPNWDPDTDFRPAYLNRIDVEIGGSATVIGEHVLNGSDSVQLGQATQPVVVQAYTSHPSQIRFTPGGGGDHYMALDNAAGPMKNVNVRRAVWAALDREALVEANGGPLMESPATHFIYPGVNGYAQAGGASGPRVAYNANVNGDLSVAERYMRLAGYPTGRYTGRATIQIVGADTEDGTADLQVVNRAFTSLGFRTRVREFTDSTMYGEFCDVPKQEIDACPTVGWVRDFGDPQSVLYIPFYGPEITPENNQNWGQVNDPQINVAIARAALVNGFTARARAWAAVDRMLVNQAVAVPETFDIAASVESADVAGVIDVWNDGFWDLDFTSLK